VVESWVVAIDVGGTFTDAVAFGSAGSTRVAKVPSTPEDPSRGLAEAVSELAAGGVSPGRVRLLSHGTTVATNALLTGRLARAVLVATEGFRDVLGFRDGTRPDIYSLEPTRPTELIARRDRLEVMERISSGGVVTPLTESEIARVVREVKRRRPESVAVALLFSYLDDRHERMLGDALREGLPGTPVTISSEVAREFREYPRTATAAMNAGLRPVVGWYVVQAGDRLRDLGVGAPFLVMQSNGGCVPAERAEPEAHRLVLSGPAAGVTGLAALGSRYGLDRLISLDMGGTSLDVCLVDHGVPPVVPRIEIGGHPILAPAVNVETLGAGGGSIVRVDRAGRLRVGPESAGADPGPASYGRGGKAATVTDAHVVAGTLSPSTPLAGRLQLDGAAAAEVVGRVADDLGMPLPKATRGILAVTLANITRALRRVSVERGIDPRDYTMVAFGGAGPLHAGLILRELGLASVLVPPYPGLFSAEGLVAADLRIDASRTILAAHDPAAFPEVRDWYRTTGSELVAQLRDDGVPRSRIRTAASIDCRYRGQGYELTVPLAAATDAGLRAIRRDFDRLHRSVYGHASEQEPVELVALRLSSFGTLSRMQAPRIRRGGPRPPRDAQVGERRLLLPSGRGVVRASVFRREPLRAGNKIEGPAIVEQMDATTLLIEGQRGRVDVHGNLWIEEVRR
jgi:N-methylhydantoinase A